MKKLIVKRKKGSTNDPTTPVSTGAGAVFPYTKFRETQNSHVDKYGKPYKTFKILGKNTDNPRIVLPRTKFHLSPNDERCFGNDINIKMCMPPKNPDQQKACRDIDSQYELGRTGFIIEAATGFGKTYLGCHAISIVKKSTLVLITKSDLEHQWRDSFKKFLGLKESDIGLIKGDIHSVQGKPVSIGYVQSVMKDNRYPSWVYKEFGMVISDEVHLMGADVFSNCMFLLPAAYRLGLSATVKRSDQKSHVFKDHIGQVRVKADILPMHFDVVKIHTTMKVPEYVQMTAGRTMGFSRYAARNHDRQKLIAHYVKKAYEAGRYIVCFAETIKHLEFAVSKFVDSGIKPNDIGMYRGGMSAKDLKVNAHKRIVVTTYKMTQYGTDFPHWDCAVLMAPRGDVTQITGRVLRDNGDEKRKPLVLDFVDDHKLLIGYWFNRLRWYKQKADSIREVYLYGTKK